MLAQAAAYAVALQNPKSSSAARSWMHKQIMLATPPPKEATHVPSKAEFMSRMSAAGIGVVIHGKEEDPST